MDSEYRRLGHIRFDYMVLYSSIGYAIVGLAFSFFVWQVFGPSPYLALPYLALPVGVGFVWPIAREIRRVSKARSSYRVALRRHAAAEAQEKRRQAQHYYETILGNAEESVGLFEALPTYARNAAVHHTHARQHFKNGAFSPFWSSIESAYAGLGAYNENLNTIARNASLYPDYLRRYFAAAGTKKIPAFPVHVEAIRAAAFVQDSARSLESLVYEAQRDSVFAQIWEQRRTTAAVAAGFANLEAAVNQMTTTISASISALSSSVQSELEVTRSTTTKAAEAASAISSAQLIAQQDLNARVDKAIRDFKQDYNRELDRA